MEIFLSAKKTVMPKNKEDERMIVKVSVRKPKFTSEY